MSRVCARERKKYGAKLGFQNTSELLLRIGSKWRSMSYLLMSIASSYVYRTIALIKENVIGDLFGQNTECGSVYGSLRVSRSYW